MSSVALASLSVQHGFWAAVSSSLHTGPSSALAVSLRSGSGAGAGAGGSTLHHSVSWEEQRHQQCQRAEPGRGAAEGAGRTRRRPLEHGGMAAAGLPPINSHPLHSDEAQLGRNAGRGRL